MRALTGIAREPSAMVIVGAMAVLSLNIAAGGGAAQIAPIAAAVCVFAAWHRPLLRWSSMIALLVVVVLVVPIKRYELPGTLPFDLELYRLLVAAVLACWASSLLIDRRVRLLRTPFDKPLLLIVFAVFASELANPGRVRSLDEYVAKSLTFLLSFVLLYLFTATIMRSRRDIELILKVLVSCGAGVAAFGLVERRGGYNVFYHLEGVLPFLDFQGAGSIVRNGRFRVIGSGQHPIAFGAALAILVPLSFSLVRTAGKRWWVASALLTLGVLATGSRTAIVMLVAVGAVFLWLKPVATWRFAPVLLPAIVVVHFAVPGALVSLKEAFFPAGGLVAEQTNLEPGSDPQLAGGRIRLLGPSLDEWTQKPVVGQGWGTRVSGFDTTFRNAPILDNQWLGTLLEIGIVGAAAFFWLMARAVRRLAHASREASERDSWLFAGFAAAIAGFGVGMLTYDTFSFIQVTFLFWIILGLAAALLETKSRARGAAAA
jgi:O-antigen ligase